MRRLPYGPFSRASMWGSLYRRHMMTPKVAGIIQEKHQFPWTPATACTWAIIFGATEELREIIIKDYHHTARFIANQIAVNTGRL